MNISYEKPNSVEYVDLRINSGMGKKNFKNAEIALSNSLFCVCIRKDKKLIGFGRVVGDGGISYVVTDIMVDKDYQRNGIGIKIMTEINDYLEKNTDDDAYIILLAKKPADKLYSKFNFNYSEPASCGMLRKRNHH